MKVLLVDDEEIALEVLERMLKQIDNVQVLGKYTDPEEALIRLKTEEADAVFLDFEMGGRHGLQFAQELLNMDSSPEVIFVTAYSQYAVDAFDVDALDYLLKPVTMKRLEKAVQKIEEKQKLKKIHKSRPCSEKIGMRIQALGAFRVFSGAETVTPIRWRTKKVKEMFCYLWMNKKQPVNKYRLLEELWPETNPDKGTALLHTTVYQLRKVLKDLQIEEGLQYINEQYVLTIPAQSDWEELKVLLEEEEPAPSQMERILELYEGDLLEMEEYDWSVYEKQKLKNTYESCLRRFTETTGNTHQNILVEGCLQKLLKLDCYSESHVMMMMKYYSSNGNRKGIIEVYEHYSSLLLEDLGIVPSRKVIELYRRHIH